MTSIQEELSQFEGLINLNDKVSPIKLASILGYNVSLLYQHADGKRLPTDFQNQSYLTCIQMYLNYYKKMNDVKVEKLRLDHESKETKRKITSTYASQNVGDGDNEMHPLIAAKVEQEIRTNRSREAQIWQKVAIEKGDYVDYKEIEKLAIPFLATIRDELTALVIDFPEAQDHIDKMLEVLYKAGTLLVTDAETDLHNYVDEMLNLPLDQYEIDLDANIQP